MHLSFDKILANSSYPTILAITIASFRVVQSMNSNFFFQLKEAKIDCIPNVETYICCVKCKSGIHLLPKLNGKVIFGIPKLFWYITVGKINVGEN